MPRTTDPMTRQVINNVWSRGCEYTFEHYEDDGDFHVVIVYCWGKRDNLVWSASTSYLDGQRILEVIRDARANSYEGAY